MSTKRTTKKTATKSASKPKRSTKKTTTKKTTRRTTKPQTSKDTKPTKSGSADTTATRCPSCGSTEREPYQQKHEIPAAGQLAPDGKPATHIKLQWTSCSSCGQSRVDRTYLNRT